MLLKDLGPWLLQEAGGQGDFGYRAAAMAIQINQSKPVMSDGNLKTQASTVRLMAWQSIT